MSDNRETAPQKDSKRARLSAMPKADLIKFVAFVAFLIVLALVTVAMWPIIQESVSGGGGVDGIVERVREAGPMGVLTLLFFQFVQVVVALIPGEAVQFAAGALYGPFWGTVIVLAGCAASSALVYVLVHKLGAPFVQSMVSEDYMRRFREFEHSGKLSLLVFILYLIPGLPKDVFSYLVPLSDMKFKVFLCITTVARIPGVVASCLFAEGLLEGNYVFAIVIAVIVVVLAVLCFVKRDALMDFLKKIS